MKVAIITSDRDKRLERILWKIFNDLPIHLLDYTSNEFLSQKYEKRWLTYSQLMTFIALPDDGFQGYNIIVRTNIDKDIAWTVTQEYSCNSKKEVLLIGFDNNSNNTFFNESKLKTKLLFNNSLPDFVIEERIRKEING